MIPYGDWWADDIGTNLLKGVEGDISNPILLEDEAIVEFLTRIPASKDAFLRMVPNMLPEEQARLYRLYNCSFPPPSNLMDENIRSDVFQHTLNAIPVRRGGGKYLGF